MKLCRLILILAALALALPAFATKKPEPIPPTTPEPTPTATSSANAAAAALGVGVGIGVGHGGSAAATGGNAAAIGGGAHVNNVVAPVATGGNAAQQQAQEQDQKQLQGQQQGQQQKATSDQKQGQQQQATATNAGNKQDVAVTVTDSGQLHYSGKYTIKSAPGIVAPTAYPTAPCIVGYSGGASVPGIGLTLGGGKEDKNCTVRENARILAALGEQCAAVMYLIAQDQEIAQVYGPELPASCRTPEPATAALLPAPVVEPAPLARVIPVTDKVVTHDR